jgi:hypothetical protein
MTSESAANSQSVIESPSTTTGDAVTPGNGATLGDGAISPSGSNEAGAANAETGPAIAPTARRGAARDPRFHIFVIDSGWNCAASKVLREHIDVISDLHIDDELYVLDRATSIALLRHYPLQVGRDPIIAVHDMRPRHRHRVKHTHGFRLHLGILDSEEQVMAALLHPTAIHPTLIRPMMSPPFPRARRGRLRATRAEATWRRMDPPSTKRPLRVS